MHGKGIPEGSLVVVRHPSPWQDCLGIVEEKVDGHGSPVSVVSLQGGTRKTTVTINDIGLRAVSDADELDFVSPEEAIAGWRLVGALAGAAAVWDDRDSYYDQKVRAAEEEVARCRREK